ncbi:SCO family protein [Noviherbaspirillum sp. UKPF54]|uniref:SCO family protein n=1 Tax=Noviherbaspirillum sp. UKPF54 TaxID=2601898 RepID=UPI0011B1074F|nr:SCO family protein [Noviherbaspirillum sp. UKPF54]QDZ28942.1 SCO family protein [Noviherbaspirillum sp. UKPF54]
MKQYLRKNGALLLANLMLACVALYEGNTLARAAETPAASVAPLPGDSVYQLQVPLVNQNGQAFELASRRGKPSIVSMFYTSCQFVCPMLIETVQANEAKLTPDERAQISTLLVSFDPVHDDVPALKAVVDKRKLDASRWSLTRTDAAAARKLAAALGIQYRQLANGDFNHSTVLILLDAQGRIVGRTNKLGAADPEFLKQIRDTLHASK